MSLYIAALGAAAHDLRRGVRETRTNSSADIDRMLKNAGITIPAPWCAAAVQDWTDSAAKALGVRNPLDDVKLEAYVQSYYNWAKKQGRIVEEPQPGYLALFNFGGKRWDHIGIVKTPLIGTSFTTIEGNTNKTGGREGDGVYEKERYSYLRVCFVAWA